MTVSRRTFLTTGAGAAASLALGKRLSAESVEELVAAPASAAGRAPSRPVVIASANGIRGVKRAYDMIVAGSDPLDAAIAGVNIQELDPEDMSVGLGGLPNEDGVVQLDASCMHGPTRRAGAVGALEGIATPSLVAKAVMEYTDHIFLVGEGAKKFALEMGFREQNLLTEKSRGAWLRWKASQGAGGNWLMGPDSTRRSPAGTSSRAMNLHDFVASNPNDNWTRDGVPFTSGTINMNAVSANGDIGSVTTTSGLSWKIPGRVGDSPIIGAGQYCDNLVGAAGSTGRGEANIKVCGAFLAVELMRQGKSPEAALMHVMERVIAMTESRLLDERGRPRFDLNYYAVSRDGRVAGACAYQGSSFAVCDSSGPRLVEAAYLFKREERPKGPVSGTLVLPPRR
ncbi:MAG TPA: N(4)-(beta-N-acetylglucosaminyl)-L-asparaginase [Candidatus Elarobacter sp.]|nr:N(4)-(beta-N-acetylglucosaminyl)-L-asparaginase [Candidatus Elarobacter sp.]